MVYPLVLFLLAQFACTDKDQHSDSLGSQGVDEDADGSDVSEDCDDNNPSVYPGADERCDSLDNNCNGLVDEEGAVDAPTWYGDGDGDGYGSDNLAVTSCEQPDNFVAKGGDCNDGDTTYHPGAEESDCDDPNDYNCDGSTGYDDADKDGFPACEECDDSDAKVSPDSDEVCDEIDNNCDGEIDEDSAIDASTWYADTDGDGYGDPSVSSEACSAPESSVSNMLDCDDDDAAVSPAGTELCDAVDNNCDGRTDEDSAEDAGTWYTDADKDGYGDPSLSTRSCSQPTGSSSKGTDCNDSNNKVSPGATETCDKVDNNCDGTTDEDSASDATTWYVDKDGDSYGDPSTGVTSCSQPSGYRSSGGDCDDSQSAINPGATELCDTQDNDCDGDTDESDSADALTWYADSDGDTYGDPDVSVQACTAPSGYVSNDGDCNDASAALIANCYPTFTGATGTSWSFVTTITQTISSLQTYQEAGETYIYNFLSTTARYNVPSDSWSTTSTSIPLGSSCIWCSAAPYGGYLYLIRNGTVSRYNPSADTWTTLTTYTGGDVNNMTESDEYGVIYGFNSSGQIVAYDTVTSTLTYYSTGLGTLTGTRLAYDPGTRAIFFGAYSNKLLYKYDLSTGKVSSMTSHPESMLTGIFCGDRSGHIYAAGGSTGDSIYQYTVATDKWAAIPTHPADHGTNGSCTVSGDGYLYIGTGTTQNFTRIELY